MEDNAFATFLKTRTCCKVWLIVALGEEAKGKSAHLLAYQGRWRILGLDQGSTSIQTRTPRHLQEDRGNGRQSLGSTVV